MNIHRAVCFARIGLQYEMLMPKVSVIVPIYNVEKFIGRCVRSLMSQTLADAEFIFVDDAAADGSMAILKSVLAEYPDRASRVKILVHERNLGLPAARNTGLAAAEGEYVFHCDSDDFVEPDMLEAMYSSAEDNDADIVWCDWYLSFGQNERYMKQPSYETASDALKGMLGGAMKYNVWNKLVRRRLYADNGIIFPSGHGMGEDMTMMMLFAYASRVIYLPRALYHYVKMNSGAFSQTTSMKNFDDLKYNVQRISDFVTSRYGDSFDRELSFLKLEAKFPFLIMNDDRNLYRMWQDWYPESNAYIMQNRNVSLRSRCVQWCASKGLFWAVRLHYYIICRFIYGIIYR